MARHSGRSKSGRGGSRGGSSRGRGRGGSTRGRGSSQFSRRTISSSRAFEEISNNAVKDDLEELHQNMHSMSFNSRRPGRGTDSKQATDPYRHQPIEFVKANHLYDPSAEYFKLLEGKDEADSEQKLLQLINTSASGRESPNIIYSSSDNESDESDQPSPPSASSDSSRLDIAVDQDLKSPPRAVPLEENVEDYLGLEDLKDLSQIGQASDTFEETQQYPIIIALIDEASPEAASKFTKDGSANDMEEEGTTPEIEDATAEDAFVNDMEEEEIAPEFEDATAEEDLLLEISIDGGGDIKMAKRYHEPKPRMSDLIAYDNYDTMDTMNLLQQIESDSISDEDLKTMSMGKLMLNVSRDESGDMFVTMPGSMRNVEEGSDLDDIDIQDLMNESDSDDVEQIQQLKEAWMDENESNDENEDSDDDPWNDGYVSETNFDIMAESSDDSSAGDSDEEPESQPYGFCEEDYAFDCSSISVKNIRFGITNSLYVKCADLTEMGDEYAWIDEGNILEYAWASGVPEHRLDAFMLHITNGEINPAPPEEPDFDVYVSDSSDEEVADLVENYAQTRNEFTDEMEDVDVSILELIASQQRLKAGTDRAFDMMPTRGLETRGKGKKKRLMLEGLSCDDAIKQALLNLHAARTNGHRAKRLAKLEEERQIAIANHDLRVKYPYSMHIGEMILEAKLLYEDRAREKVSYPPLDYHGFDTLKKIATALGMSLRMAGGNGKHQYAKMIKRKNSHKYYNDNLLAELKRGRPVFNRTDQKRPREEIVAQDGNLAKDKARGRNGVKTTVYQEGEIVGATAPQIADSNFGRQMLLRLGWTHGEGLGAHGNKGISEPVMAKIKKTKEGLKKS